MKPRHLSEWAESLDLNKVQVSAALGIARSTLDRYLEGRAPIPRVVALACTALLMGLQPYPGHVDDT